MNNKVEFEGRFLAEQHRPIAFVGFGFKLFSWPVSQISAASEAEVYFYFSASTELNFAQ